MVGVGRAGMSSRLIDDPDGVSALAAQVSDRLGIPAEHVEKDFWVTEVLRGAVHGAAQAGVVVVFKGGTSLSNQLIGLLRSRTPASARFDPWPRAGGQ